tara:strand:+ start:25412 stop:25873 length:462 start_codon:yes stop_codon:yes gene_type:complete
MSDTLILSRSTGFNFMMDSSSEYGVGETSYIMAGKLAGISKLVDDFYINMDNFSEAKKIRSMHQSDLFESKKKLAYFLSGWLGGPKLYAEHYGCINIPAAHQHLSVGVEESHAWLLCMEKAIDKQPYEAAFKVYLLAQLAIPAARIRVACGRA